MKITEALCDWIEDAGGTATESEQESIVNAMHTLYTAMGGEEPEVMPDDIATWVQYLSTVAGGGGGTQQDVGYALMNVTNTCGKTVSVTHITAMDGVIQEYREGVMNNKTREYYPVGLRDGVSSDPIYRVRFKLVSSSGSPTSITVTSPTIDGVNAGVEQDAITNGAYVTVWYNSAIPSGEVITVAVA